MKKLLLALLLFATPAYAQMVINRNGIVDASVPEVVLPGPQDIDGPDAVWDDNEYYFSASFLVAIWAGDFLVGGPSIGGSGPGDGSDGGIVPIFGGGGGGGGGVILPPPVEGGSGGGIVPPAVPPHNRFDAHLV